MGLSFGSLWTNFFPPKPTFTAANIGNLDGKVYIVTGSNSGLGKEVASVLYSKHATVYMAARSEAHATDAMKSLQQQHPTSQGRLVFMNLDLSDLRSVQAAASFFREHETQLHVLFNNAGVMHVDPKHTPATTAQGHEMNMGVNVLGTFLLTKLLTPVLVATAAGTATISTPAPTAAAAAAAAAASAAAGEVRIVWVSSLGTELQGEPSVGLAVDRMDVYTAAPRMDRYAYSKTGNWLHGVEAARRLRPQGVVSVPVNPGNLRTALARQHPIWVQWLLQCIVHPPPYGACTELYAAFSPDISLENSGTWVAPFGRLLPIRADLMEATKTKEEGGNGSAVKFWDWAEEQVQAFT